MIISIVMCIVKFGVDVAHQHYDFKAVFRYKLSSPAFYRGLILVQKQIKEPVKKQKFKISGKKAVLILTFNLLMNIIIILFPLICFVLFFTGLFMLFGYDTLDTIYFVIVSLSSVGYGDITFKDESYGPWGKILTMVFIISAIIYVPIELGNIIDNIKVKIPMIVQKYQITNGIVIIGEYDKALASMMRLKTDKHINIVYIVTEEKQEDQILAFESAPNFSYIFIPNFDHEHAAQYDLFRANHIIVVSQQYNVNSDIDAMYIGKHLIYITQQEVLLTVILNNQVIYNIAKKQFQHVRNSYILCYEQIFGLLVDSSIKYPGLSTVIFNIMANIDDNFELNYWKKDDISGESKQQVEINRNLYNKSLQWKLSGSKAGGINKHLGIDYFLSYHQQVQRDQNSVLWDLARKFEADMQEEQSSDYEPVVITKIGIVAFDSSTSLLLNQLVHLLADYQIIVFQKEDNLTQFHKKLQKHLYSNKTLDKFMAMQDCDVIVALHPNQKFFVQSETSSIQNCLKTLKVKLLTVTDEFPRNFQNMSTEFRHGLIVPFTRAYFIANLYTSFKRVNICITFLENIFMQNTILKCFTVKQAIEIRHIQQQVLYVVYNGNIIVQPDLELKLNKGDQLCVIDWINRDQVMGEVIEAEILKKRATSQQLSQIIYDTSFQGQ
ncbi:Ion_transport 2 and transmembrane domain-containing protein [Hexamita inflata]|uniref:Ion transport 2 and transmembrane domain-containing protein n=1 Tax=Hexamita inflata TaxID=28002 RepID=A0AA86TX43_9EUKA|nr:Ion transport 2 and transmembrane domain-containing protein [Hexamita inflata]